MFCKKHGIIRIEDADNTMTIISGNRIYWMLREIFSEILFSVRASYLQHRFDINEKTVSIHIPEETEGFCRKVLKDSLILSYVLSSIISKKSNYTPIFNELTFGLITGLTPDIIPIYADFSNNVDKISPSLQGAARRTGRLCRALRGTIYDPETIDFAAYVKVIFSIREDPSEVINALQFMSRFFSGRELEFIQVIQSAGFPTILGTSFEVLRDLLLGDEK